MKIFVFVGPTIPLEKAKTVLPVGTFLPPVAQGDVATLLRHQPDIIGIIDGYFERIPAVWHKEILLAIKQRVRVVGAASMGALRAAELASFGMDGIGEIFQWYHDGVINGDDEVAIRHMPAQFGYQPMSEAMVNIRKTLQVAQEQEIISLSTQDKLIHLAKNIFYAERAYDTLWQEANKHNIAKKELNAVRDFVEHHAIDLKQKDGLALLEYLANLTPATSETPEFELHLSPTFARSLDRDIGLLDGTLQLTTQTIVNHARLELENYTIIDLITKL